MGEAEQHAENGELYPVFPFRCFGLALGTGDLVAWTMKHRTVKDAFGSACWTQDQIHWAYAGNGTEAADGLVRRFRVASPDVPLSAVSAAKVRTPAPTSIISAQAPSRSSGCSCRKPVRKILLLPAWPADWDVDFKLHLSQRAILTGTVKAGRLTTWDIHPASRKKDVVVCQPQPNKPLGPVMPSRSGSACRAAARLRWPVPFCPRGRRRGNPPAQRGILLWDPTTDPRCPC